MDSEPTDFIEIDGEEYELTFEKTVRKAMIIFDGANFLGTLVNLQNQGFIRNYSRMRVSYKNLIRRTLDGIEDVEVTRKIFIARSVTGFEEPFVALLKRNGFEIHCPWNKLVVGDNSDDIRINALLDCCVNTNEIDILVLFSGDGHFLRSLLSSLSYADVKLLEYAINRHATAIPRTPPERTSRG